MKIYTKTGDRGETGLFGGPRVRKDDPRIEAYGTVDELNAVLGLARCEPLDGPLDALLASIQNELFDLGAELATPDPQRSGTRTLAAAHIARLEAAIDQHEAALEPLKAFIL
ncbi:MAG TPA: ATP:cob(I)alamin adenosyltransferase, partial [Pirellulales bacterium]|nr:ATP:cob(I)alamin adenosyltransferase [Pirellulales bacterium]